MKHSIPFFHHDLGEEEVSAVRDVLRTPILTTGETVARFERKFADYLGARHALGLTSCTAAIQLSLSALRVDSGDEVITTPMTFIATATAIIQAGAVPVFVDVEPDTGNLDASKIEAAITAKTKAILPVHLYGLMCDMKHIRAIADLHGLSIVEDCAHCIEGARDEIRPGQLGDTACFSFYATKNITCGEGGAVVTRHDELNEKLKLLRHHGMTKTAADRHREGYKPWDMVAFGWKYNMDNIQAALLLPQMKRIDNNREKRQNLAALYLKLLSEIDGIKTPSSRPDSLHARHLFPIWVDSRLRDGLIDAFQSEGIGTVVNYSPVHLTQYFRETYGYKPGDFPVAERIGSETLSLPLYPKLSEDDVRAIAHCLEKFSGIKI